jgi:putative spermidine/putrescine transport system permease protein
MDQPGIGRIVMAKRKTVSDRSYDIVIGGLACLAIAILVLPVAIVLLTSFTTSASLKFPPPSLSTKWYEALFDPARSRHIHQAAWNSLSVAAIATALAAACAVLAALSISKVRAPSARGLEAVFLSPLILPTLAYGLATLMFFTLLGQRPSLLLLTIGHMIVIAPFIFRTSLASLTQLDPSLLEASLSLGASRFYTFRRVTLPLIAPGIVAGAFIAFVASLDNVPVSLFLSNARTDMLPIRMWGMMESTLDVRVAAISGVLIAAVLALMIILDRLVGLTKRVSG